jgi:protein-disulfide isomerase
MSNRNSKASKEAARIRLREQREKEAKRAKVRRQLLVGGGVVALIVVAGGVAVAVSQMNKSSSSEWDAAKGKTLVQPANSDGTTIVVGDKNNKNNLDLYEDLRCPACAQFEQTEGADVLKGAKDGKYKITYHFGTFLDGNLGGTGSKNALAAVGAAVNVSLDAFEQYHTLLYSTAHHPAEDGPDVFAKDANMINLAQGVPALKNNAAFNKAVNAGTYDKWAMNSSDAFDAAKITSTPTAKLNGVAFKDTTGIMAQIEAKLIK